MNERDDLRSVDGADEPWIGPSASEPVADLLVVEDSAEHGAAMAATLRGCSYGVRVAATGTEAVAAVASRMPDLVILDIALPDIDGYDVCRLVRRLDPTGTVPVIFVSACDGTAPKLEAFAAGAIDYLTKPFGTEELLARVDTHLRAARRRRDAEELSRDLATANRILQSLSANDPLTGVGNRRQFEEWLTTEWRRGLRAGSPLGLVLVDIDYYPGLAEDRGRQLAEECLRRVAEALRNALRRPGDSVSRFAGELFAVLLPDTDAAGACEVAEALRLAVERLAIENPSSPYGIITVSAGAASMLPMEDGRPGTLLAAADTAVSRSKVEGRNRSSSSK